MLAYRETLFGTSLARSLSLEFVSTFRFAAKETSLDQMINDFEIFTGMGEQCKMRQFPEICIIPDTFRHNIGVRWEGRKHGSNVKTLVSIFHRIFEFIFMS